MFTIKKSTTPAFVILMLAGYIVLLLAACNGNDNNGKANSVVIDIPKDFSGLDTIDHFISEGKIKEYKAAFISQRDSLKIKVPSLSVPESEAFNKRAILSLLKAPDCVGIRIYHGVKTGRRNEIRLVLVGVDSKGKDILIDKSSILTAKIAADAGGVEDGQCPTCLSGLDN